MRNGVEEHDGSERTRSWEKGEKKEQRERAWVDEGWWTFQIRPQGPEGVDEGRTDRHTRVCRHCRRATRVSEARVKKATLEKRRERSVRTSGEREREMGPGRTHLFL